MAIKLKYQPPGVQFAVFFGLAVGMFLLNVLITNVFFGDIAGIFTAGDKPVSPELLSEFKWAQFAGTLLTFVAPPVIYGVLCDQNPLRYVGMKRNISILPIVITVLLLMAVQPLAMMLGEINKQANFGAAHNIIKSTEELYERILLKFMVMDSPTDLLINLVIVAMLPAIGEELFFRGALQNILEKWIGRPIIAIGLSSFCFALFHGTFFKFLPIFVLGVTLGTLFYITRNLWYSIFFHFLNNALALLASYYAQRNEFIKKLADDELKLNWMIALVSLAVTVALFYLLRKRTPAEPLEQTWKQNPYDQTNIPR